MHIKNTTAARCRYGEEAAEAFKDAEVLWEDAEDDYQGHAAMVGRLPDSRLFFYEWWYGSCSGCDDWEARDLTSEQIQGEMQQRASYFSDASALLAWLDMTDTTGALYRPKRQQIDGLL